VQPKLPFKCEKNSFHHHHLLAVEEEVKLGPISSAANINLHHRWGSSSPPPPSPEAMRENDGFIICDEWRRNDHARIKSP